MNIDRVIDLLIAFLFGMGFGLFLAAAIRHFM